MNSQDCTANVSNLEPRRPPVDGKANAAVIKVLAEQFGVANTAVTIESGESSRQLLVCIKQSGKIPGNPAFEFPQLAPGE